MKQYIRSSQGENSPVLYEAHISEITDTQINEKNKMEKVKTKQHDVPENFFGGKNKLPVKTSESL